MFKQLTKTVATAFSSDPLRDFKINKENTVVGFRHEVFSINEAVDRATGNMVSVFTAKRRDVVLKLNGEAAADAFLEEVRKSINLLSQMSHPSILRFERPLTVAAGLIFFVTERVNAWLPSIELKNYPLQLKKLELQHCIAGLSFLHERFRLLVLNFGPHSVYMTPTGWKIGDLCHAVLPDPATQRVHFTPLTTAKLNSLQLTAPFIDYIADECLDFSQRQQVAADTVPSLFGGTVGGGSLALLPHCDVFSFLVMATEVLLGHRIFCSKNNMEQRQRQSYDAGREVTTIFPQIQSLSASPRPELVILAHCSTLFSEDIRLLLQVENLRFDDPKENIPFGILKTLYDSIGERQYCNEVLISCIVPFSLKAAKHQRMLRYILPITIQCASVLPVSAVPLTLKQFFANVMSGVIAAPNFSTTGVLALQLLEKITVVQPLFDSPDEQKKYLLPFYLKCISSTDAKMTLLSLQSLNCLLNLPMSDSLQLPQGFIDRLVLVLECGDDQLYSVAIECVSRMLSRLSEKEKCNLEICFVKGLKTVFATRQNRLGLVLGVLQRVQQEMSPEHLAQTTIPLLSHLLLSNCPEIRNYAASTISSSLQRFDAVITQGPSTVSPYAPSAVPPPGLSENKHTDPYSSNAPVTTTSYTPTSLPTNVTPPAAATSTPVTTSPFHNNPEAFRVRPPSSASPPVNQQWGDTQAKPVASSPPPAAADTAPPPSSAGGGQTQTTDDLDAIFGFS